MDVAGQLRGKRVFVTGHTGFKGSWLLLMLKCHVARVTGRRLDLFPGECHVHAGIREEHLKALLEAHPGAEFLIHPECGCALSVVEAVSAGDVEPDGVHILSTEGMMRRPGESPAREFIVATEVGLLHRLQRRYPGQGFYAANERASCAYMKVTTLAKVAEALEHRRHRVAVADDVAARARRAIARMVEIGGASPSTPLAPGVDPGE